MPKRWKQFFAEYYVVIIFTASVFMLYHGATQEKKTIYGKLLGELKRLETLQQFALKEQEELKLKIKNQEDPEWLEMVLMRKLGVVPEGHIKVHFDRNP